MKRILFGLARFAVLTTFSLVIAPAVLVLWLVAGNDPEKWNL